MSEILFLSIYHLFYGDYCRVIKDKHEWLKLQCVSLFQREYITVHTGTVVLLLGLD